MILQYLSKSELGTIDTVEDGVISVDVNEELRWVDVFFQRNGKLETRRFHADNDLIYDMWLLNDNFKTLKQLI